MMRSLMIAIAIAGGSFATQPAFAIEPSEKITLTVDRWRKPGSNNIGTADVTITNDNAFAVKDIRVKCDYTVKASGRKIDTTQGLAVTVKAGATAKFRKLKFGFIDTAMADGTCKVVGATQI